MGKLFIPYTDRVKSKRAEHIAGKRNSNVRMSVASLRQLETKGFVFTDNLAAFATVVGHLNDNQIPFEYIDGGKDWAYALRRIDDNPQEVKVWVT